MISLALWLECWTFSELGLWFDLGDFTLGQDTFLLHTGEEMQTIESLNKSNIESIHVSCGCLMSDKMANGQSTS